MVHSYIIYIDEAGDEGLGKLKRQSGHGQSNWLFLGACIVRVQNDKKLPTWRNDILEALKWDKSRDLHFQKLNHDQRIVTTKYLAKKPLGICVVGSNKITLLDHPKFEIFKQKGHLYNYLVRFLLERVTFLCAQAAKADNISNPSIKVVFSRRGGTDYHVMASYLKLMRDGKEVLASKRSINWNILDIDNIRVENHSKWAGLQIADAVTSAYFKALEPNFYGNYETSYALHLKSRLIKRNGKFLDCGLTLIPPKHKCPLNEEQKTFICMIEK